MYCSNTIYFFTILVIIITILSNITTIANSQNQNEEDLVLIIIDGNSYFNLYSEINRLKEDIIDDMGVKVEISSKGWKDGYEVRSYLKQLYEESNLIGAILIGNVPTMYFSPDFGMIYDEIWPSDYLFMDLESEYDIDNQGIVNYIEDKKEGSFKKRDIWVGRIKPPSSTDQSISLLRDYLNRNHEYRLGYKSYDESMVYYPYLAITPLSDSNDCYGQFSGFLLKYTSYDSNNIKIICGVDNDAKNEYLSELTKNHELALLYAHGTDSSQTVSSKISKNDLINNPPGALCCSLLSCRTGDFTKKDYLGGWYLFSGQSLVIFAFSAETQMKETFFYYYGLPLSSGLCFGDTILYEKYMAFTILGDPTLRMRYEKRHDFPDTKFEKTVIDFGEVLIDTKKTKEINVTNFGKKDFMINTANSYRKGDYPNITSEQSTLSFSSYVYPFNLLNPEKIQPGQTVKYPFMFEPTAEGDYSLNWTILTNDPKYPYLDLKLTGTGVKEISNHEIPAVNNDGSPGFELIIFLIAFLALTLIIRLYKKKNF